MITHLEIKNFQKWALKRIIFDPHITTIVGPSDEGKSAIIRSLRWICTNKPRGNFIIKNGTDFVEARVRLSDSNSIKRKKSKKENLYFLNKEVYKAFSAQVPEEITTTLNVSEINFQQQFDAAYWFHLSPGEVAKEINKIVDLTKADEALSYIKTDLRSSRDSIRIINSTIEKIDSEIETISHVKEVEIDLKVIEDVEQNTQWLEKQIFDLHEYLKFIHNYDSFISLNEELYEDVDELHSLGEKIKTKEDVKRSIQKELLDYKKSYDPEDDEKLDHLERLFSIGSDIKNNTARINLIETSMNLLENCREDITKLKRLHSSCEEKIKDMQDVCPECGRPL